MPEPLPSSGDLIRPATARGPLLLPPVRPATVGAASAAKPAKESLPMAVLHGIARRWRTAVVLGAVFGAAVGAAVWFFVPPPLPTAAAKLNIPQKPLGQLGEHPDPPLERSTQLEWLRSRIILNAAIRDPDVANLPVLKAQEDPLDWLGKKIKAEYLGAEILQVSLTCSDPEQARILVNAVTNAYLERVANKSGTDRAERLKRLNEYAAEQEEMLKRQRESMRTLSKVGGVYESEKRLYIQNQMKFLMADAQRQLSRAETDLRGWRAKERFFAPDAKTDLPDGVLDAYVDSDQRVRTAAGALKQAEEIAERNRQNGKNPDQNPVVRASEAKVASLKKEHDELRVRTRSEAQANVMAQSKAERAGQQLKIRAEIGILEQQVESLKIELDEYSKTLSDSLVQDGDLAPVRFKIAQIEKLLERITQSITMLKVEQDAPSRVDLMEAATITRVDAEKRKMMLGAAGAAAGFLLAFGLVGLWESRSRRVESPEVVYQQLGLRLVGTVPTPKAGPLRRLVSNDARTTAILTEAIANTRTMLLHGEGSADHRVILITSAVSGEGKTSLSAQLGVSVALAGHKTLLIDGDLRNPTAHERLGMENGPGVCELLRGEVSLFEVVRETTVPGLHLISAGRWTAETANALVAAPLRQLFTAWREQYEFVILDSSPVLPVTDALLLARHVDGVILSLLQGVSRLSQVTETCDRFTSLGVNVIGAIVNGTPARSYGGSGKYYYQAPPPTEQG